MKQYFKYLLNALRSVSFAKKMRLQRFVFPCGFSLLSITSITAQEKISEKPNVLFIVVDDLNTTLGAYGSDFMKTPNIDRLAENGVLFKHAYVQQAICAASRASFLTGLRPRTAGVNYPYSEYFVHEITPNYPTISEFFKENGYFAHNIGKIHHGKDLDNNLSMPYYAGKAPDYFNKKNIGKTNAEREPYEASDTTVEVHGDYLLASEAISTMRKVANKKQPFFLAVGFRKPHLPFIAPKSYFDLYPVENIPLPLNPTHPIGAEEWTINKYALSVYNWEHKDPSRPFSAEYTKTIRQAYYACVSFIDDQIGRLIHELEVLDELDNTIIVLVGDHGYHLGEQNHWSKNTDYEASTQVPLIISGGKVPVHGQNSEALVEAVDIYPTLAEMCGLPVGDNLEGTSMLPILNDPDRPWKKATFSRTPRGHLDSFYGYSIRTKDYRYVRWEMEATDSLMLEELYDYKTEPRELYNLVDVKEYQPILNEMRKQLKQGWKAALPEGIENNANNLLAPDPYPVKSGGEGRREAWLKTFGGSPDMDWKEAERVRREAEKKKYSINKRDE